MPKHILRTCGEERHPGVSLQPQRPFPAHLLCLQQAEGTLGELLRLACSQTSTLSAAICCFCSHSNRAMAGQAPRAQSDSLLLPRKTGSVLCPHISAQHAEAVCALEKDKPEENSICSAAF